MMLLNRSRHVILSGYLLATLDKGLYGWGRGHSGVTFMSFIRLIRHMTNLI